MKSGGFAAVPNWLLEREDVTGQALLVYLALASFADGEGVAFPSLRVLAARARLARSTTAEVLKGLRELGAIAWEQQRRPDGSLGVSVYRLQPVAQGGSPHHGLPHPQDGLALVRGADGGSPGGGQHELDPLELDPIEQPQDPEGSREDVDHLCSLLSELMTANGVRAPKVTKDWRTQARLLLDRDGIPLDLAERVMRWCQQDTFWRSNVLGMPKFRAKFDQLRLRMEADAPKQPEPELPNPYRAQEAEERRQLLAWLDALGVTEAEWNARRAADDRAWLEALKARVPA